MRPIISVISLVALAACQPAGDDPEPGAEPSQAATAVANDGKGDAAAVDAPASLVGEYRGAGIDGTEVAGATTLLDQFAVPEFLNLSDEDKLTRPSFETLPSGVATGSGGFAVPSAAAVEAALDYELVLKTTGNTGIRFSCSRRRSQ